MAFGKDSPLESFLLGLLFGLTAFFLLAWIWDCSLHFFSWKFMNFHIIQAWVRQMADRQVILKEDSPTLTNTPIQRLTPE